MAELEEIIEQTEQLSPQDKLLLVSRLVDSLRLDYAATKPRRRWREIAGIAPNLLPGTDAQEWVSQNRREADAKRESQR